MKKQICSAIKYALNNMNLDATILEISVSNTKNIQHGDYASNIAMILSNRLGQNPRQLANMIVENMPDLVYVDKIEIAGPGFINFFIDVDWLAKQIDIVYLDDRCDIKIDTNPKTIVVDYSSPNIAKEMHVGHIRSTIIGDAVVRVLEFVGHNVIRANHIGDWGTQFGMLICHLEELESNINSTLSNLTNLESFYRESKFRYDREPKFAKKAKNYVVRLQNGDEYCLTKWKQLVDITLKHNQDIYKRLNVSLTSDDTMGESMYNNMLEDIVIDLENKNLAVEHEGAMVVHLTDFKGKDGEVMGVIVRKSGGGYLYATTDIACAKYRYEQLQADRILYFVDSRQHQHLNQVQTIVRKAGYIPDRTSMEHHSFGMMLGKNGKPFKTRVGDTVKLSDLLDEAEKRAGILVATKLTNKDDAEFEKICKVIAIGAVKYSDLSKNRTSDYIFDWDNMIKFEGNTAPYLQYAYVRIQSILNKSDYTESDLSINIKITHNAEELLAKKIILFNDVIENVIRDSMPHYLCDYLFNLTKAFMYFYETCPINMDGVHIDEKISRLKISMVTAKTLKIGLGLLGIEVLEQM